MSCSPLGSKNLNGADYCPVFSFDESPVQNDRITMFLSYPRSFPEMKDCREIGVCRTVCACECLLILPEIRTTGNICISFTDLLCSYTFQVQNLNNIMAFPLENVLKSELRDSRLVSLDFLTNALNTNKTAG